MKLVYPWLRELVDVPGDPDRVASEIALRGFEVASVEHGRVPVIDFEITANRPDCMSVVGMACEVATAYGLQVRRPAKGSDTLGLVSLKAAEKTEIDVVIENAELCPRYAGAVADVTVGPSPAWMQKRLQAAGVRPISNIVDVTNYVLLEMGQPMHAFDVTALAGGRIRGRKATPGERLKTLDGQTVDKSAIQGKVALLVFLSPEQAATFLPVPDEVTVGVRPEHVRVGGDGVATWVEVVEVAGETTPLIESSTNAINTTITYPTGIARFAGFGEAARTCSSGRRGQCARLPSR